MKTFFLSRILLLGGFFAISLTSCSTGTDPGETNVESAPAKTQMNSNTSAGNAPDPQPYSIPDTGGELYSTSDAATNGTASDTSTAKTGKQVYDQAADRHDENVDGKAGPQ